MKKCIKCKGGLKTSKQEKYCGERCQKLYLKSQYKKRNRDKVNAYNRSWRAKNKA